MKLTLFLILLGWSVCALVLVNQDKAQIAKLNQDKAKLQSEYDELKRACTDPVYQKMRKGMREWELRHGYKGEG